MHFESDGIKKSRFFIYFAICFAVIFLISFTVLFNVEKRTRLATFNEVQNHETQTIELEDELLGHEFGMIIADLNYLSRMFADEIESEITIERLIENWKEFSYQRGIYDQIRFINAQGYEEVRINLANGGAYVADTEDLENVYSSDYYVQTAVLDEGDIYISALDLEQEDGVVQVPYNPMIRFCTPIYTQEGDYYGIVVLNYLAENLLDNFRDLAGNSYGEMILLNSNGDFLSTSYVSREWNFMFEGRKSLTFGFYFDEWDRILSGETQFVSDTGLFTYSMIDLSEKVQQSVTDTDKEISLGDGNWYIVSYVLREDEEGTLFVDEFWPLVKDIFRQNLVLFGILLGLSAVMAYLIFIYNKAYNKTKMYSKFDSLTHVYNRRAGTERLEELVAQKDRRHSEISLCFIDVNGLKEVNDVLGHRIGDELIITVTSIIRSVIREDDYIARMGGDEFLVLFSGIGSADAERVWQRIVSLFEKINEEESRPYLISVSHGIECYNRKSPISVADDLIKSADIKMYDEKRVIKCGLNVIRRVPDAKAEEVLL